MSKLILMCGIPGSGKSTWTEKNCDYHTEIISRDAIRFKLVSEEEEYFSKEKQVFNEFIKQIDHMLSIGCDVIADATHISKASRKKLVSALRVKPSAIEVVYIKTSLEQALTQNENRKGTRSYVPHSAIRRMYEQFEKPTLNEGFDKITTIEERRV